MFNGNNSLAISHWFHGNVVSPIDWDLVPPQDVPPNISRNFVDYINDFHTHGYKVWNINNLLHATSTIRVKKQSDERRWALVSGRADYLITKQNADRANYLAEILGVIEIQSGQKSESKCIDQLLWYLFIYMNTKHLLNLVGFLVLSDGRCKAFKATRDENNECVYEVNGYFNVCHIATVFNDIYSRHNYG